MAIAGTAGKVQLTEPPSCASNVNRLIRFVPFFKRTISSQLRVIRPFQLEQQADRLALWSFFPLVLCIGHPRRMTGNKGAASGAGQFLARQGYRPLTSRHVRNNLLQLNS